MPDKEIMIQIRALEEQLAWSTLDALVTGQTESGNEATGFHAALVKLAEEWRTLAGLYERAKGKGFASTYVLPLRHAATQLDKVIKQLDQPRRAPLGQIQPVSAPPATAADALDVINGTNYPPRECPKTTEQKQAHAGHNWIGGPQGEQDSLGARGWRWCSGHIVNTHPLTGLDALIADAVAAGELPPQPVTVEINGEDVTAYLKGGVDDLAATAPALGVTQDTPRDNEIPFSAKATMEVYRHALTEAPAPTQRDSSEGLCERVAYEDVVPEHIRNSDETRAYLAGETNLLDKRTELPIRTAREILENNPVTMPAIPPVPLLGQPGDAGAGYASTYVPPGGVALTYADLLTPVPLAALPAHISHSQIDTIADCGVKYRGTRLAGTVAAPGVIEIPQWALIGGSVFHAAIEDIELWAAVPGAAVAGADMAETLWRKHFDAEVQKIEESSPVPRSRWRASKQGAEGETWWNANGPEMIRRYLAARPAEPTALLPRESLPGYSEQLPAIEIELSADVPTAYGRISYRAILDRVTVRYADGSTTLVIRDYKTSASMPSDTSQLGEYANLLRLLGVPPQVRIVGTLFNARKGTWTPEVDLDAEWPAEWFTYHITQGHAQKFALTQGPTPIRPSSFCGGCPVRWACPVKGVGQP